MVWNTTAAILQHAESHPDSLAIAGHDRTITYDRLRFLVAVMAGYLRQGGVKPGQVTAVTMALHPLQLICTLALSQIGAVMLPLHMAVPADRRLLAAQRFGASWVISGRDEMRLPGLSFLSVAGVPFDGTMRPDFAVFPTNTDTPFRIALSSGTSGDPKGVLLTHGMRARRGCHLAEGMGRDARVMTMDLNFAIGYAPTMAALTAGACLVLPHSFAPGELLQTMVRQQVTHVAMSPAQAREIVSVVAEPAPTPQCPSLVNLRVVGGSLTPRLHEDLQRKLTPNVFTGYGATELGSIAVATPDMLRAHPGTVGLVRPWVELEIVDEHDQPLPAGSVGSIRTRSGDQVSGYYLDEARSRRYFRDGWFYSGDRGRLSAEGVLFIEGRNDEVLNVGGLKINPEDTEATLFAHDAVKEAGAFLLRGVSEQDTLAVALVLTDPARLGDVQAHARKHLGPLAPKHYFLADALPRTITGKLRRSELSERYAQATDGL